MESIHLFNVSVTITVYTCFVLTFVDANDALLISHIPGFHKSEVSLVPETSAM